MSITIGEEGGGCLLFELFTDILPKTCRNFIKLCTGELGYLAKNEIEQYRMHFLNTIFFRLVPGGWIQGGGSYTLIITNGPYLDILYGCGDDGRSIYSETFDGTFKGYI